MADLFSGVRQGGIFQGIVAGRQLAQGDRRLDLTERQLAQDKTLAEGTLKLNQRKLEATKAKELRTNMVTAVTNFQEQMFTAAQGLIDQGVPMDDPRIVAIADYTTQMTGNLLKGTEGVISPAEMQVLVDQPKARIAGMTDPAQVNARSTQATGQAELEVKIDSVDQLVDELGLTRDEALIAVGLKKPPPGTNFVNVAFPDGSVEMIDENNAAAMFDADSRGGRRVSLNVDTTSVADTFVADKTETRKTRQALNTTYVGSAHFADLAMEVVDSVEAGTPVGLVNKLTRLADDVGSVVRDVDKIWGVNTAQYLDPSLYDFEGLGLGFAVDSAVLQSNLIALAYMGARANGQTGRAMSDNDLRLQLETIGAKSNSPAQLRALLLNSAQRFLINAKVEASFLNKGISESAQLPFPPELQNRLDRINDRIGGKSGASADGEFTVPDANIPDGVFGRRMQEAGGIQNMRQADLIFVDPDGSFAEQAIAELKRRGAIK